MRNKLLRAILLLSIAGLAVACGTQATPVYEAPDEEAIAEASAAAAQNADTGAVAVVPTETPIPPTPTEEPTATPTEEPTAIPTEEPTAAPADPIARLVASRDPAAGEALFNEVFAETGFACATCHHVDILDTLIGPGLVNIKDTAATRIEGMSAERYIYDSIINPNDYIVEGFTENVMPQNWHEVLTDTQIYEIMAYLMTLDGSS